MRGSRSWAEQAALLGLEVEAPEEHAARWLESLRESSRSEFSRALKHGGAEEPELLRAALDAAAGLSREAERMERSWLGESWDRATASYRATTRVLALPPHPPPGVDHIVWAAYRKLFSHPGPTRAEVEAALPQEVALVDDYADGAPRAWRQLQAFVADQIKQLDAGARAQAARESFDLTNGQVFRNAWQDVFGNLESRPTIELQLMDVLLSFVFPDRVRPIALFAHHCGLIELPLPGPEAKSPGSLLKTLDARVHNGRKPWRRLAAEGAVSPRHLCDIIELLAHEGLAQRASWTHRGGPPRKPLPGEVAVNEQSDAR